MGNIRNLLTKKRGRGISVVAGKIWVELAHFCKLKQATYIQVREKEKDVEGKIPNTQIVTTPRARGSVASQWWGRREVR